MSKKTLSPLLFIILILFLGGIIYYIFSYKVVVDEEGGVLTQQDAVVTQETSYEKEGNVFKFKKNRVTKTAEVEISFGISDDDEFVDFFGEKVTMMPFFINLTCGIINTGFFDPEGLEKWDVDQVENTKNLTENNDFKNALEGYRVSSFKLEYKNKESGQLIATCQSNQMGFENINFVAYRDYSEYGSFLGHKIGEIPE